MKKKNLVYNIPAGLSSLQKTTPEVFDNMITAAYKYLHFFA